MNVRITSTLLATAAVASSAGEAAAKPLGLAPVKAGAVAIAGDRVLYARPSRGELHTVPLSGGASELRRRRLAGLRNPKVSDLAASSGLAAFVENGETGSEGSPDGRFISHTWVGVGSAAFTREGPQGCREATFADVDGDRVAYATRPCDAPGPERLVVRRPGAAEPLLVVDLPATTPPRSFRAVRLAGDFVAWLETPTESGDPIVVRDLTGAQPERRFTLNKVGGLASDPNHGGFDLRADGAVAIAAGTVRKSGIAVVAPGSTTPNVVLENGRIGEREFDQPRGIRFVKGGIGFERIVQRPSATRLLTTQLARVDDEGEVSALTAPFAAPVFAPDEGDGPPSMKDSQIEAWDALPGGALAWSVGDCLLYDARPKADAPRPGACRSIKADPGNVVTPSLRSGALFIRISCIAAPKACQGTVTVGAVRGRRGSVLAAGAFTVKRWGIARIRVPLTGAGRAFFTSARTRRSFQDPDNGEILGVAGLRMRDGAKTVNDRGGLTLQEGEYE